MLYRIINVRGKYTCESDSDAVVAATIMLMGGGMYGAISEDDREVLPIVAYLDQEGDDWFRETYGEIFGVFFGENRSSSNECLESLLPGTIKERKLCFAVFDDMDREQRWALRERVCGNCHILPSPLCLCAWELGVGFRARIDRMATTERNRKDEI